MVKGEGSGGKGEGSGGKGEGSGGKGEGSGGKGGEKWGMPTPHPPPLTCYKDSRPCPNVS